MVPWGGARRCQMASGGVLTRGKVRQGLRGRQKESEGEAKGRLDGLAGGGAAFKIPTCR